MHIKISCFSADFQCTGPNYHALKGGCCAWPVPHAGPSCGIDKWPNDDLDIERPPDECCLVVSLYKVQACKDKNVYCLSESREFNMD